MSSLSAQVGNVEDTITGRTSCLVPNTKATKIKNTEDNFRLFFDKNIIKKAVDHTNNKINEIITCLKTVESYNQSIDKYRWVRVTKKLNFDRFFGLMYFRGFVSAKLDLADKIFYILYFCSNILSC